MDKRILKVTITYQKVANLEVPAQFTRKQIEQEIDDTDLSHIDYEQFAVVARDVDTNEVVFVRPE